jgi:hypothetical protein
MDYGIEDTVEWVNDGEHRGVSGKLSGSSQKENSGKLSGSSQRRTWRRWTEAA